MNANEDINGLGGLWQSLDKGPAPSRPIADIARRRRSQRLQLWLELAIAAVGAAVGAVLVARGTVAIGVAAIVFSLFGAVVGWLTRSMNIGVLERSVSDYVAASAAILKARRNHNVAGVAMFVAALVFYAFVRATRATGFGVMDVVVPAGLVVLAVFYLLRAILAQRQLRAWFERVGELEF